VLTIPQNIVGTNYLETQQILETLGFIVQVDEVANEAEAGDVLYTEPGVGSVVAEGGTITLFYSSGDEDDDHPGGGPPKGAGKGRDKDKDKDDD
jgi:beta-lactam-binding protein with PASTA domain